MSLEPQREIEAALREARELATALTSEQMNWRPAPGVWSVAECLDHLTITCRRMMKAMDAAVDELRANNKPYAGPARPSLIGRLFLKILEPPIRRMKVKAPAEFVPNPDRPTHLVLSEFTIAHEELLHRFADFQAWDQNPRSVVSPFNSRIRYSLGLTLAIIPAHMRRHLWQARQVLRHQSSAHHV